MFVISFPSLSMGNPKPSFDAQFREAILLASQKKYNQALEIYNAFLKSNQRLSVGLSPRFWFHKGSCESKLGKIKESRMTFQKGALSENGNIYWKTLCQLALAENYYQVGEVYAARSILKIADDDISKKKWQFSDNKNRVSEKYKQLMKKYQSCERPN